MTIILVSNNNTISNNTLIQMNGCSESNLNDKDGESLGHLWDLVYVLYELCTDRYCYISESSLDRSTFLLCTKYFVL